MKVKTLFACTDKRLDEKLSNFLENKKIKVKEIEFTRAFIAFYAVVLYEDN